MSGDLATAPAEASETGAAVRKLAAA